MHFGYCGPDIRRFTGHAHVPIRDPFDTSVSWQHRYGDAPEKYLWELKLWDELIQTMAHRKGTTFYRIEDMKLRVGETPKLWANDKKRRGKALEPRRLRVLRDWIVENGRLAFFEQFYPKFWWLNV
jgi:hypothetical protein